MGKIHILLFYKYVSIEDLAMFREQHLNACLKLGVRGRILVAPEGINGSVSGTKEQTESYKSLLCSDVRFSDILFKEDTGVMHPFRKMEIKIKKEIVAFGQDVDLSKAGTYLSPREFLEMYETEGNKIGKDIIILDARNEYESRVGRFKGALLSPIKNFRDFPKVAEQLSDKKDKKIVMYCTGGIRCEKASAYLKQNGFHDVSQLHGGILTFGKEFPDTIWEGTCFVFDKRLTSAVNTEEHPLTICELCNIPCDLYRNCAEVSCDKFCTVCLTCEQTYGGCCSEKCFEKMMKGKMSKDITRPPIKRILTTTLFNYLLP